MAWRSHGKNHKDLIDQLKGIFFKDLIKGLVIKITSLNSNILVQFRQISLSSNFYYPGHKIVKSANVYNAMLAVDRKEFCPNNDAYKDSPQPIGSNVTISAPHMHAHALETLASHLKPGNKVLDVGSGSGYLSACMAIMVSKPKYSLLDHFLSALGFNFLIYILRLKTLIFLT